MRPSVATRKEGVGENDGDSSPERTKYVEAGFAELELVRRDGGGSDDDNDDDDDGLVLEEN